MAGRQDRRLLVQRLRPVEPAAKCLECVVHFQILYQNLDNEGHYFCSAAELRRVEDNTPWHDASGAKQGGRAVYAATRQFWNYGM
jgi:hypothetical protein